MIGYAAVDLIPVTGSILNNAQRRRCMKKLLSLLVAAVFAVSSGLAFAASHTGAQPMKKDEMKKDGTKKDGKKKKKSDKKGAKKDEMKK
jgi:hypothetical protein